MSAARPGIPPPAVPRSPFARSGLVALDGFEDPAYPAAFEECARAQTAFLAVEDAFRSAEYPWDRDALRQWSRCWEYPYVLAQLRSRTPGAVVDFGSGVTFFPFALARAGWAVTCVDNDPLVIHDLGRAAAALGTLVHAVLNDGPVIPLADASADAVYSISVLEHLSDPLPVIAEAARILRPGGPFVLTMDVDLQGDGAIGPQPFDALLAACAEHFEPLQPEVTIHPRRMLDCFSGPRPRAHQPQVAGIMLRSRNGRLRPLIGGPIAPDPVRLACYVATFVRR
ncbi:MAG: class I SAM-dependent methyltransferase [Candidatus Elarobacter sp.]